MWYIFIAGLVGSLLGLHFAVSKSRLYWVYMGQITASTMYLFAYAILEGKY